MPAPHPSGDAGTITRGTVEPRSLTLAALKDVISRLPVSLRHLAEYQFGWRDETGRATEGSPGKLVRSTLTLLCARAAGGGPRVALPAAVAVELVHNFSVLHDDVMDRDAVRRHRPTVWSAFGTAQAVLLADALLALAFRTVADLDRASATSLGDALLDMVEGQARDLAFEGESIDTVSGGLATAAGKTGSLLRCACRLGALSAGADGPRASAFGEFGEHLGLAFQLTDDLLGIWGDPQATGKPADSDLRSRKRTLPVLAALTSGNAAAERLAHLYAQGPDLLSPSGERSELAGLIEDAGGRTWAERRSRQAFLDAMAALERAQPDRDAAADLLALAESLTHRTH